MSIPERFYRIAKYKYYELRERVDQLDSEAQERALEREERDAHKKREREEARKELDASPAEFAANRRSAPPERKGARPPLRTPEEIANGLPAQSGQAYQPAPDPLAPHYRLLGLEQGADFGAVQNAYQRLMARCDASQFPIGTEEAREVERIRKRLEETFKVLKDALDPTARRFDLLELDMNSPSDAK